MVHRNCHSDLGAFYRQISEEGWEEDGGRLPQYPLSSPADSPAPPGSAELPGLAGSDPPHWGGMAGDSAGCSSPRARCPRGSTGGGAHHHSGPPTLLCGPRPSRAQWQEPAWTKACYQGELPTASEPALQAGSVPSRGRGPSLPLLLLCQVHILDTPSVPLHTWVHMPRTVSCLVPWQPPVFPSGLSTCCIF